MSDPIPQNCRWVGDVSAADAPEPGKPISDIAEAVHMAALDDLLEALEIAAQRPDVIAVMQERNAAGENYVRKVFGEAPVPPRTGALTCLTLKAGTV